MEAVNLLPGYARPAHGWAAIGKDLSTRRVLAVGGAVAGAAAIALGGLFVHERSVVNEKRDSLSTVQAQLTAAEAQAAPLRAVQAAKATKLSAIRTISEGRVPWENVLRDLARVLPSKIQVQAVQATLPTPIAPATGSVPASVGAISGAPTGFTITGSASSHNRVALVLDRLSVLPWLSNVMLQSSTRGTGGTSGSSGADTFTISATFNSLGVTK